MALIYVCLCMWGRVSLVCVCMLSLYICSMSEIWIDFAQIFCVIVSVNQTQDLLIIPVIPYRLGHMLPWVKYCQKTVMPVYLSVDKFVVILFSASRLSTMSNHITIRVDKDYRRNTATSFSWFQHEKKFWDCKIILGSETLYCHSYIVSSLSPVIEEMIDTKIRDGSEKEITFYNIHPDVMWQITNCMYTGSVNIPQDLVLEVVQVCDELKIKDLKERCLYRVPDILSPQTAISWLKYARKHSLDSILWIMWTIYIIFLFWHRKRKVPYHVLTWWTEIYSLWFERPCLSRKSIDCCLIMD